MQESRVLSTCSETKNESFYGNCETLLSVVAVVVTIAGLCVPLSPNSKISENPKRWRSSVIDSVESSVSYSPAGDLWGHQVIFSRYLASENQTFFRLLCT